MHVLVGNLISNLLRMRMQPRQLELRKSSTNSLNKSQMSCSKTGSQTSTETSC
jgi:hypothetical protein